jgi:hypothetical protein
MYVDFYMIIIFCLHVKYLFIHVKGSTSCSVVYTVICFDLLAIYILCCGDVICVGWGMLFRWMGMFLLRVQIWGYVILYKCHSFIVLFHSGCIYGIILWGLVHVLSFQYVIFP